MKKKQLMYRVVPHNGGLVFAEPGRAHYIARIHRAINFSGTWGEFRKKMPPAEYSYVVRTAFDDNCEPRPRSTDPFAAEDVPGWSDGDYPPWLQQEMEYVLPESILESLGSRQSTFLNGNFWLIPEDNLEDVCAALEAFGWELVDAQDLEFL
jgi:hypothetical protein